MSTSLEAPRLPPMCTQDITATFQSPPGNHICQSRAQPAYLFSLDGTPPPQPPRDALEGKGPQRLNLDGTPPPPAPQGCIRREGTSEAATEAVGQALEEVAKAVGGGYCRLQVPLKLALGVRETVAGHRLGALSFLCKEEY